MKMTEVNEHDAKDLGKRKVNFRMYDSEQFEQNENFISSQLTGYTLNKI